MFELAAPPRGPATTDAAGAPQKSMQEVLEEINRKYEHDLAEVHDKIEKHAQKAKEFRKMIYVQDRARVEEKDKKVKKRMMEEIAELKVKLEKKQDKIDVLEKVLVDMSKMPMYMMKRERIFCELEKHLAETLPKDDLPYEIIPLRRGQGSIEPIGVLKAVVKQHPLPDGLLEDVGVPPEDTELMNQLVNASEYVVRIFILRAMNLVVDDADKPDAYLKVRLGDKECLNTRANTIEDVFTAYFYETVEVQVTLPGESLLSIEVHDREKTTFGLPVDRGEANDELLGQTEIDLEDRVFSNGWQEKYANRPPRECIATP